MRGIGCCSAGTGHRAVHTVCLVPAAALPHRGPAAACWERGTALRAPRTMHRTLDIGHRSAASQTGHRVLGAGTGIISGSQCLVPGPGCRVSCVMAPCMRQLAASTGVARQVRHPGTTQPVVPVQVPAPGAASWALHKGGGCWALHTRHGHGHCTSQGTTCASSGIALWHWVPHPRPCTPCISARLTPEPALQVCLSSWTEPSCPASVPCLSSPCVCLGPQQCRMVPWGPGAKLSQAFSHFLQALPARNTDGETLVSPLRLLATNWREVGYGFVPEELLPQAGAGQAVQTVSWTLLGCLGPCVQDVPALVSEGQRGRAVLCPGVTPGAAGTVGHPC